MAFIKENILTRLKKNKYSVDSKEELEKRYDQLKENMIYIQQLAQIGSWTYDVIGKQLCISHGLAHILEVNLEDLGGSLEDYYTYVHSDDRKEAIASIEESIEGKEGKIEYRILTANKQVKFVHQKTKAIYDEFHKVRKVIGMVQDITEQKIIEKDLKSRGDNLSQTQVIAGVGNWRYDVINDKFYGSDELFQVYGISSKDFKNSFNNALKFIYSEDRIKVKDAMDSYLAGKSTEVEFRIQQPDGFFKYAVVKGKPIFDEDKNLIYVIGTVQDITEKKLSEDHMTKAKRHLKKLQTLAQIGTWEMDVSTGKNFWSEEACRLYGIKAEEYDGRFESFLRLIHPDDRETVQDVLRNPPDIDIFDMEFRMIRPDQEVRNIYGRIEVIFDSNKKPDYIYGTFQDITEKTKTQDEINKAQRKFQALIRESDDVFEIIDPDGTIKYISDSIEKIIGRKAGERIGQKTYEFFEGKELRRFTQMIDFVLKRPENKLKSHFVVKVSPDKDMYLEVKMQNLLHDPDIEGIVVNYKDITRRIEMEKRITRIATYDEVTGLPNNLYFKKQLRVECQSAKKDQRKFGLMMLDVGGIRYINYSLGFEYGHIVLNELVSRLKTIEGDIFISHNSENNFALIVRESKTYDEYKKMAKDIIGLLSAPYKIDKYELDIWVNIGISIYGDDADNPDSLRKHAKVAILRSRKEGKNRYDFHSSEIDVQNYREFTLRSDLHNAIEKNQLRIEYQPMINLKTNEILAAEALLRWEHPDWGILSANEFISIAEDTRYIFNIGHWVLRQVCRDYKNWRNQGLPNIKISINFLGIQFLEKNFVEKIKSIIDEFGLDPSFLIIEIKESIYVKKVSKIITDIRKLQSYGIKIALDNFGSGFSSFNYLKSFDIDLLKIDASFIRDIIKDRTNTIVTKYIIDMAKELRIKLVADGIENWDQLSFLKGLNCYTGQGPLYSEALTLNEFEELLKVGRCKPNVEPVALKIPQENRRKFFRIKFNQLLEADLTIKEINGRKVAVGNTKVLVKNMGPGGLCFVSNVKFPVKKYITLQFVTELIGGEIKVYGNPVWSEQIGDNLYEYGIEFNIDENERTDLTKILNKVQIKMRNNIMFAEGSFITGTIESYFDWGL